MTDEKSVQYCSWPTVHVAAAARARPGGKGSLSQTANGGQYKTAPESERASIDSFFSQLRAGPMPCSSQLYSHPPFSLNLSSRIIYAPYIQVLNPRHDIETEHPATIMNSLSFLSSFLPSFFCLSSSSVLRDPSSVVSCTQVRSAMNEGNSIQGSSPLSYNSFPFSPLLLSSLVFPPLSLLSRTFPLP